MVRIEVDETFVSPFAELDSSAFKYDSLEEMSFIIDSRSFADAGVGNGSSILVHVMSYFFVVFLWSVEGAIPDTFCIDFKDLELRKSILSNLRNFYK